MALTGVLGIADSRPGNLVLGYGAVRWLTVLASVEAAYTSPSSGATTTGIETTDATLIEVTVASYSGAFAPTLSDSKTNTWVPLTAQIVSESRVQKFYVAAGATGSGHTFTLSGATAYAQLLVRAYTGLSLTYAAESGTTVTAVTTIGTGSVTPAVNGALVTSGLCWNVVVGSLAVSGGSPAMTAIAIVQPIAATRVGGASADTVQTTAAAINPTWTWTTAAAMAGCTACYSPAAPPVVGTTTAQAYVWGPV